MKVLFFSFYNKFDIEVHPGVAVLSAALKKNGHLTKLQPYFYFDPETFTRTIEDFKPDMIGISATHMAEVQVEKLVPFLKTITEADITVGGVLTILDYEKTLRIDGVDAVCIGEGVDGVLEYAANKHPATNYIYKDGRKGEVKEWSSNPIDELDYNIFYEAMPKEKAIKKLDYWTCFTCEYGCTFCCNKVFRKIIGLKNKPRQSQETAINNIKTLISKTECNKIHFRDPLFCGHKEKSYVLDFLELYRKEINLPFTCNMRADSIDDEIVKAMGKSGCRTIKMGLESGSEALRNKALNKGETDIEFRNACSSIKKHGIRLSLNAMVGLPYETVETARQTVDMMLELGSEKSFLHIFQPWPGLNLKKEIVDCIKYVEAAALYDESIAGRQVTDFMNGFPYNEDKAKKETIRIPVLDQPNFTYELALKLQSEFQRKLNKG